MEKAIAVIVIAAFILVMSIAMLVGGVILATGINQAHCWEEWGSQDDRKGAEM